MRILHLFLCILVLAAAAPVYADTPAPNQVVQGLVDDLGKTMEARRGELSKDREGLLKVIDGIVLPHFDIDYASILVLGQNARTATPEQRAAMVKAVFAALYPDADHHEGSARSASMHTTDTIDYAIVLEGEIVAVMDRDETLLRAGDILIQRGTAHGWENRSDGIARIAFILIDAVRSPTA